MNGEEEDMAIEALPTPAAPAVDIRRPEPSASASAPGDSGVAKLDIKDLNVYYGKFQAVRGVSMTVLANCVTAIIGPSGSGKSTLLRSINRMTDLVPNARAEGQILMDNTNVLDAAVDGDRTGRGQVAHHVPRSARQPARRPVPPADQR